MTDVWTETAKPAVKFDQYGRYLVQNKPHTRVTTFIDAIKDGYHLNAWKRRMVAIGITDHRSLQLEVAACRDDKKTLDKVCERAISKAKGDEGSSIGTSLHDLTEAVDCGRSVNVPEPWDSDVNAYRRALVEHDVEILPDWIEGFIVNRTLTVAGRFDRFVRTPGIDGLVAWDLKTGADCYFTEHAAQLALYAYAEERWDPNTDTTEPMPADVNKSVGIICHLPEGRATCTLYVVDIAAGWQAAQLAHSVRKWWSRRNDKSLAHVYDPAAATATRRAYLWRRAERLRDANPDGLTLLAALWPAGVSTFKQCDTHTTAELDAIEKIIVELEARFALPFLGGGDPEGGLVVLDCERMIARLQALPADLLAAVEAAAVGKVPHLRSLAVRREHLDALEQVVTPIEAEHARRVDTVKTMVNVVLTADGPEFLPAVVAYATAGERTVDRVTADDLPVIGDVCDQLADGRLVIGWDDDGVPLLRGKEEAA